MSSDRPADYSACEAVHAEANALIRADFTQIQGGTMYVSAAACINCARLMANSGVSRVVHRVTQRDMHRNPTDVEDYLKAAQLAVIRYVT